MHNVTITVVVPEGAPPVYLAGNLPELGPWHPAALEIPGDKRRRTVTISVPHGHTLRYKVTADSWEREGRDASGTNLPEFTAVIDSEEQLFAEIADFRTDPALLIADWQGANVEGKLVYWKDVKSEYL